jgi:hypothetical protein
MELVAEAYITLQAIHSLKSPGMADPLVDPKTLSQAVIQGILDAPHLRGNRFGRGEIRTRLISGMNLAVDENGIPLQEEQRLAKFHIK